MNDVCPRCGTAVPKDRLEACPRCLFQGSEPPAVIAGMELGELIGRGGMGEIYLAKHVRLGRTVALKLLPEELAEDAGFLARFEREAKALAMLNHPNIVTIYDYGREGGQSYIAMEYVAGKDAREALRDGPMPLSRALDIALQICDALMYAHARGIIHRDIKPENILIDGSGRVKVTDFGIARLVGTDTRSWTLTTAGKTFGTPLYLAPETLQGAAPDPRTDVYSLGVVIYQTLTGEIPMGDFAAPPGGEEINRVIRRALAQDPAQRYPTIEEFRRDLATLAERASVPSARDELPPDEKNWIYAVAMLQSISTAVALWAFLACATPRVLDAGEVRPLIMVGTKTLEDGRIVSMARFELYWVLAALATFAAAITAYALLRRHWRRENLEIRRPERTVPQSRIVLALGVVAIALYGVRKLLESPAASEANLTATSYVPILGGLIVVWSLFFFWVSILHAWRIHRPLRHEPTLWLGFALTMLPPVLETIFYIRRWRP